jgi:hypothetical protein
METTEVSSNELTNIVPQIPEASCTNGRNQAGAQVASGVYFYRLEAQPTGGGAPFINVRKMVLLK